MYQKAFNDVYLRAGAKIDFQVTEQVKKLIS